MLMSTTRCLNTMKAWVVDTGLIPGETELDEGLKLDMWGILTPSRNKVDKDNIIVQEEEEENMDVEAGVEDGTKNKVDSTSSVNLTPQKMFKRQIISR